jgi:uncharacterized membrane protein (UPF0136 family)
MAISPNKIPVRCAAGHVFEAPRMRIGSKVKCPDCGEPTFVEEGAVSPEQVAGAASAPANASGGAGGDAGTSVKVPVACECGTVLNVPQKRIGTEIKCPKCQTRFVAQAQLALEGDDDDFEVVGSVARPTARRAQWSDDPMNDRGAPMFSAEDTELLKRADMLRKIVPAAMFVMGVIGALVGMNEATRPQPGQPAISKAAYLGGAVFGAALASALLYQFPRGCGITYLALSALGVIIIMSAPRMFQSSAGSLVINVLQIGLVAVYVFYASKAHQIRNG